MAQAPTAAPMPPPAAGAAPPGGSAPDDADTDMDTGDGDDDSDVILTVCKDPDGGFTLYQGDEPEGDEEEGEGGEEPPAEAGAAAGGMGAEGEDKGEHFDTAAALMKGIMQLLEDDTGAEDSFGKAFAGGRHPSAKPMPGM